MQSLADRIRIARTEAGLSKAALAKAVGVSGPTVTDWESGKISQLRASNLLRLATVLQVSADWLESGKGPMRPIAPVPMSGTHPGDTAVSSNNNALSREEAAMLDLYRGLSPDDRTRLREIMSALASARHKLTHKTGNEP